MTSTGRPRGGAAATSLDAHVLPAPLDGRVRERLEALEADRVVERTWQRDHTLWADDPTEITDRLGWLDVDAEMAAQTEDLEAFRDEVRAAGFATAVLLGMGGSSLAARLFADLLGDRASGLGVHVLDSTVPGAILDLERRVDLDQTLFIASSKSGGTIETRTLLDYFWDRLPEGARFAAITDGGSSLEAIGRERGFRRVFRNRPDIGGRFSALSYYGLVPAVLAGANVARLLEGARAMREACGASVAPSEHPGAVLGAILGEAALAERDRLTLLLPDHLETLGAWLEQLIAESTGKHGKGILPIAGEPLGPVEEYGPSRLFAAIGEVDADLGALEATEHPVVRLPFGDAYDIGRELYRWEFATAIAGHVLRLNPFDQPDVEAAKQAATRALEGEAGTVDALSVEAALATLGPRDYVALHAYVPRTPETDALLRDVRRAIRAEYRLPTTAEYGPSLLHSTGQYHKGGPAEGVCIQVVEPDPEDLAIPGRDYTFGQLKDAQALGDLAAMRERGKRVARATVADLEALARGA